MRPAFNRHVESLETPAIPTALAWGKAYSGEFGPLIDLSQAVPNYAPDKHLLDALAAFGGDTTSCGYGDIEGEPELRTAFAALQSDHYKAKVQADNIHITSGCNQAFVATLMALASSGDTVIMSNPGYFNHEATINMLGLKVSLLPASPADQFVPSLSRLESLLQAGAKLVALVTPNNPTGAIYSPDLLDDILTLCQQYGTWLVVDETYRDFIPLSRQPAHTLFSHDNVWSGFISLYSFSKAYSIPGHRLGAVTAGSDVVSQIAKVMDNLQICPHRAAQLSLASTLAQLQPWVHRNTNEIETRAAAFIDVLASFPEWEIQSIGAYFAYVKHPWCDIDSVAAVKLMARDFGVLPLPGDFFGEGQSQFLRFAFANVDLDTIAQLRSRLMQMREISNTKSEDLAGV